MKFSDLETAVFKKTESLRLGTDPYVKLLSIDLAVKTTGLNRTLKPVRPCIQLPEILVIYGISNSYIEH